jgi:hypothetical protein
MNQTRAPGKGTVSETCPLTPLAGTSDATKLMGTAYVTGSKISGAASGSITLPMPLP